MCECKQGSRDCTSSGYTCDNCRQRAHAMARQPACGQPHGQPCGARTEGRVPSAPRL